MYFKIKPNYNNAKTKDISHCKILICNQFGKYLEIFSNILQNFQKFSKIVMVNQLRFDQYQSSNNAPYLNTNSFQLNEAFQSTANLI